jgi:hypothetical protein
MVSPVPSFSVRVVPTAEGGVVVTVVDEPVGDDEDVIAQPETVAANAHNVAMLASNVLI